jgi:hypothetical protein
MYNEFWTYTQSSHFVGCWLCCVTSWMSREHSLLIFSPLLLCLYCRLFQHQTGWVWLGLLNHPFTHFPRASSWDFWIWAIPWHSVQNFILLIRALQHYTACHIAKLLYSKLHCYNIIHLAILLKHYTASCTSTALQSLLPCYTATALYSLFTSYTGIVQLAIVHQHYNAGCASTALNC